MDPSQRPNAPTAARQSAASAAAKGLFPADSDTHLLDRLNAIYKYRYVIVTIFLLVMLGGHRADLHDDADVSRDDERADRGRPRGNRRRLQHGDDPRLHQDPEPYYQTQLRILTGRELAIESGDEAAPRRRSRSSTVRGPQRTGLSSVLAHDQAAGARALRASGRRSGPVQHAGRRSRRRPTRSSTGFSARVSVDQVRGSRLVNVSVTSSDPALRRARGRHAASKSTCSSISSSAPPRRGRASTFSPSEIAKQQKKVEDSERAMAEYRETNNALSLEDRQNTVVAEPESGERSVHAHQKRADSEGSALQPGQVAAAGRAGRLAGRDLEPAGSEPRARDSPSCSARRCSSTSGTGRRIPQVIENENAIIDTTKQLPGGAHGGRRRDPQRLRDRARPGAPVRRRRSKSRRAPRWI